MAISWRRPRRPRPAPGLCALALAGLLSACGPQSVADRNGQVVDVGGAMRAPGDPLPATTPPITPAGESTPPVIPPPPATDAAPPDPDPAPPTTATDAGADTSTLDPPPPPAPPDADPPPPPDAAPSTPDTDSPDAAPPPPPPPPPPPTDPCATRPTWQPATPYTAGDQVTNGKPRHRYECRPWPASGWCPLAAYEPGHPTTPWSEAWIDHGTCP